MESRTPLEIFMEDQGIDEARAQERLEMIAVGSADQYRQTIEGMAAALGVVVEWPSDRGQSPTERLRAARGDDGVTVVIRPPAKPAGSSDTHLGVEES